MNNGYMPLIQRVFILLFIFFVLLSMHVGVVHASITGASDTISTSRPSASTVSPNDAGASDTQETISDNNSVFLASDSATFRADTGETLDTGINIASMSASNIPGAGQRVVYFTQTVGHTHHKGDALTVPITAMHTVNLTIGTAIPSAGKIILTFPTLAAGDANTPASPSATTFQTNNLAQANFKVYDVTGSSDITANFTANSGSITITAPTSGNAPVITLLQGTTTTISANHSIRIFVGCTALTGSGSSVSCSSQVPTLINPTRSKTAGTGGTSVSADIWKLNITTQDNNSVNLESSKVSIGTIESVQVQATIDPTLTFTIAGLANGTNISSGHGAGCNAFDNPNSGIDSTSNFVNLGVVNANQINIAAQDLTVSTNGQGGYTLTATSSGQLRNPANGYGVASSTTFTPFTAIGTEYFGIHACGTNANASFAAASGTNAICGASCTSLTSPGAKIAWPTQTTSITIASYTAGAISNDKVTVEYAGTASGSTPEGTYGTVITYVATPTFN